MFRFLMLALLLTFANAFHAPMSAVVQSRASISMVDQFRWAKAKGEKVDIAAAPSDIAWAKKAWAESGSQMTAGALNASILPTAPHPS